MDTNIATLSTERLERIGREIGGLSTKMVKDAYRIGALLNEARELCATDKEFGDFRAAFLEPAGISRRTAARMSQMARAFDGEDALPENVNLSVLYILTSPSTKPAAQDAILERIEAGDTVSVRDAENVVAGINNAMRRGNRDPHNPDVERNRARVERPRRPVVVEGNARRVDPVEVEDVDADMAWADNIVSALRNKAPGPRGKRLAALVAALREKGLLRNDGATIAPNMRDGVIEVTC